MYILRKPKYAWFLNHNDAWCPFKNLPKISRNELPDEFAYGFMNIILKVGRVNFKIEMYLLKVLFMEPKSQSGKAMHGEKEREYLLIMTSYTCNCHHGWYTQAIWSKSHLENLSL